MLHVGPGLRTFDGQVAVQIVGGPNCVQNFNVMTGHVEVTEREILFQASSEVAALLEVRKMPDSHPGHLQKWQDHSGGGSCLQQVNELRTTTVVCRGARDASPSMLVFKLRLVDSRSCESATELLCIHV